MRIYAGLIGCCFAILVLAHTGVALVTPLQDATQSTPRISVDVELVNVVFAVFDRKGKFVTDLRQDQFRIYEDNELQTITHFSGETELPLTVAFIADTSGSIMDQLPFEREAATEFFRSNLRRGKDKGLVLTFASDVHLLQDYTDDPELIAKSVTKMRAGGGTALYDAIYIAATQKLTGQEGRRAIILISDGDDTSSRSSPARAIEAAQRNEVTIYTISTNKAAGLRTSLQEKGDKALKKLGDETGGKAFSPARLQDLKEDFQNIGHELRSQYALAYRPSNERRDGTFRRIRVEVADRRYTPRVRPGYFAPNAEAR